MQHHDDDIRWANNIAGSAGRRLGFELIPAHPLDLNDASDIVLRLTPQERRALNIIGLVPFVTLARIATLQLTLPGM